MGFLVLEILELFEGVTVEQAGEDGEEVKPLPVEINADGKSEPSAWSRSESGLQVVIVELVNVVAEVLIDFDLPVLLSKHAGCLGTEPRPIHCRSREMRIGEPTTFDREFGRLFFGKGK